MFNDWRNIFVVFILLVFITPILGGASCNTRSVVGTIRTVHMGVREAGMHADEALAPHLEEYGDVCIQHAADAGFGPGSGEEGMAFWRECMEAWLTLETAMSEFRNSLEELENVYADIEAGVRGETDWRYWAGRVLDHGRTILRFIRELDVGLDSTILQELQTNLDSLCRLLGCNQEA
jgi:hypothetical protein